MKKIKDSINFGFMRDTRVKKVVSPIGERERNSRLVKLFNHTGSLQCRCHLLSTISFTPYRKLFYGTKPQIYQ